MLLRHHLRRASGTSLSFSSVAAFRIRERGVPDREDAGGYSAFLCVLYERFIRAASADALFDVCYTGESIKRARAFILARCRKSMERAILVDTGISEMGAGHSIPFLI